MRGSRRPMLVLAIPTLQAGGAERVFTTLAAHLDTDRFDVRLAVFSTARAASLAQIPAAVEVVDLQAPRVRDGVLRFAALMRRLRPDAVMSTLEHLNKALCATRPLWPREVRHVVRLTHVMHLAHPGSRAAARWLYPIADGLVFQSQAMRAVFDARLNLRHPRAAVIENPVDVHAVRAAGRRTTADLAAGAGAVRLVAAGSLEPRKGFDLLLQALARTSPRLHLTLLGDGPERGNLEALVERLGLNGRVRLIGHQGAPYPYLAQADGFVLSSRSEGFPNVVLEALACGTPVVATPVAGLESLLSGVPHCQVARALDAGALAEALDRFAAAPPGRAPADVVAPFEAGAIARRYEAFLLDVIAGRRPR